jgi:hypothetical protein
MSKLIVYWICAVVFLGCLISCDLLVRSIQPKVVLDDRQRQEFNAWRCRYVQTLGGHPDWNWQGETTFHADVNSVIMGQAHMEAQKLAQHYVHLQSEYQQGHIDGMLQYVPQNQYDESE